MDPLTREIFDIFCLMRMGRRNFVSSFPRISFVLDGTSLIENMVEHFLGVEFLPHSHDDPRIHKKKFS
jgi:hypothetical protein